jgi:hypothetical protein
MSVRVSPIFNLRSVSYSFSILFGTFISPFDLTYSVKVHCGTYLTGGHTLDNCTCRRNLKLLVFSAIFIQTETEINTVLVAGE